MRRLSLTMIYISVCTTSLIGQASAPTPAQKDSIEAAQRAQTLALLKRLDSLQQAKKAIHFGLSLGARLITDTHDKNFRDVSIDPVTSNLVKDGTDGMDIVLSGVVVATPFSKGAPFTRRVTTITPRSGRPADTTYTTKSCFLCRIGFIANINLASFSPDAIATFNHSLEGGFGISLHLSDDFALAATYERVFSRRLRSNVEAGKPLVVKGETLTSISKDDNRFFLDDNLNAGSFKFVFFF
jgi:hypothetical protein